MWKTSWQRESKKSIYTYIFSKTFFHRYSNIWKYLTYYFSRAWTYVTDQFNILTNESLPKANIQRKYENMMKRERVNYRLILVFKLSLLIWRISKWKTSRGKSETRIQRIWGIRVFQTFLFHWLSKQVNKMREVYKM